MRKWITLLMTAVIGSVVSYANADTGQVTFEAGYRHDNLSWRHHIPSSDPVIKTNTRFKDIDIFQIGISGCSTFANSFYLRGEAYWGWVLEGDYRQTVTTFMSNPSSNSFAEGFEFSKDSHNVVDDRWVYGVGGAIGYPFYFCDCTLILAPVIGYAVDEQSLRIHDEGFEFSHCDGLVFPTSGKDNCHHHTIFRWYGPFAGFDFNYNPCNECWNIWGDLEYHWGYFRGKRHHRGFDFFNSQRVSSHNATAWVFYGGADYEFCDGWTLGFSVKFQDWRSTRHRRHRAFNDEGYADYLFSHSHEHARINNRWHSYAVNLTVGRRF